MVVNCCPPGCTNRRGKKKGTALPSFSRGWGPEESVNMLNPQIQVPLVQQSLHILYVIIYRAYLSKYFHYILKLWFQIDARKPQLIRCNLRG